MGRETDILFDLIKIWAGENELYSLQGLVKSVSESTRTCVVTPSNGGPDVLDVRLEADYTEGSNTDSKGFFVVPTVGSLVVITFMSKEEAFISAWTEISNVVAKQTQWTFNDGVNDGMVKVIALTNRLNDLEALFDQLQTDFNTWAPVPSDGGAALKVVLTAGYLTDSVPSSTKTEFENTKVKH
jgi:prolyl oligopeptidase PreP (S9A serine peptidase family)